MNFYSTINLVLVKKEMMIYVYDEKKKGCCISDYPITLHIVKLVRKWIKVREMMAGFEESRLRA